MEALGRLETLGIRAIVGLRKLDTHPQYLPLNQKQLQVLSIASRTVALQQQLVHHGSDAHCAFLEVLPFEKKCKRQADCLWLMTVNDRA
jgi:hypothetical protein